MSFRAPFVTQFLYKHGYENELSKIEEALKRYDSNVKWVGRDGVGYFHGIVKGLHPEETVIDEQQINEELKDLEIKLVFNHEN